jgi:hypothetical protein
MTKTHRAGKNHPKAAAVTVPGDKQTRQASGARETYGGVQTPKLRVGGMRGWSLHTRLGGLGPISSCTLSRAFPPNASFQMTERVAPSHYLKSASLVPSSAARTTTTTPTKAATTIPDGCYCSWETFSQSA